ncbi:MAG: HD-GYP domain-containing protein [Rhodospirillales bacterium]|nr:HD-GYP domain-containing protein [Rhodospirillales bacterium]
MSDTSNRTLLAVEPEPNGKLMQQALSNSGMDLVLAWDAYDLNELLNTKTFSVAVISSEVLDGSWTSVAHTVRNTPQADDAKILLVMEQGDGGNLDEADKSLVDVVMPSPFSIGSFVEVMSQFQAAKSEKEWLKLNKNQQKLLRVTKSLFGKHFSAEGSNEVLSKDVMRESGQAIAAATQSGEIWDILETLKNHDSYTFVHALKVSSFMTLFGVMLGLKDDDLQLLSQAGLFHDVGKRETPVDVLNFPGKLDAEAWKVMQEHPGISEQILADSFDVPKEIVQVAGRHHEKMDGSGYPRGLKGSEIDDLSAICAIADVYSGLTDKRSYKPPFTVEKTLEIMGSMSGGHLEPHFLDRFLKMIMDRERSGQKTV